MIPTYTLTGEKFEITGRGTVYTATLTCACNHNDVCELIGTYVKIDGEKRKILGVEQFAVHGQSYRPIGLLVSKKSEKID